MPGGNGGDEFRDLTVHKAVKTVKIRSGSLIDGLQLQFKDDSWSNGMVETQAMSTSLPHATTSISPTHSIPWTNGVDYPLVGFSGRAGSKIDNLELVYDKSETIPVPNKPGKPTGGLGGTQFDMVAGLANPALAVLHAIKVRADDDHLYAVECIFMSGETSGEIGKSDGGEYLFRLNEGEYINRVTGTSGDPVYSIQIHTNQRMSPRFGGSGGKPFDRESPKHMTLLCFQGATGSKVDNLLTVWSIDREVVRRQLRIDRIDNISLPHESSEVVAAEDVAENHTNHTGTKTFSFTLQTTQTSTITLAEESRRMVGGETSFEVSYEGEVRIPAVVTLKSTAKAGIKVIGESEWTKTMTDSTALSRTITSTYQDEFPISPLTRLVGKAFMTVYKAQGTQWTGEMDVWYRSGAKATFPVSGTFDSTNGSRERTEWSETKI